MDQKAHFNSAWRLMLTLSVLLTICIRTFTIVQNAQQQQQQQKQQHSFWVTTGLRLQVKQPNFERNYVP
jgi:preprotein translocase subunit YajC